MDADSDSDVTGTLMPLLQLLKWRQVGERGKSEEMRHARALHPGASLISSSRERMKKAVIASKAPRRGW